jgi:hypothetical protein
MELGLRSVIENESLSAKKIILLISFILLNLRNLREILSDLEKHGPLARDPASTKSRAIKHLRESPKSAINN